MSNSIDKVKAKLEAAAKEAAEDQKELDETQEALEELSEAVQELEEPSPNPKVYHKFKSARQATRLVTDTGTVINFTHHQFITNSSVLVTYLRGLIDDEGFRAISYEGTVESPDADPMAALRKQFYAEFQKEQQTGQTGIMTTTGVASA